MQISACLLVLPINRALFAPSVGGDDRHQKASGEDIHVQRAACSGRRSAGVQQEEEAGGARHAGGGGTSQGETLRVGEGRDRIEKGRNEKESESKMGLLPGRYPPDPDYIGRWEIGVTFGEDKKRDRLRTDLYAMPF